MVWVLQRLDKRVSGGMAKVEGANKRGWADWMEPCLRKSALCVENN